MNVKAQNLTVRPRSELSVIWLDELVTAVSPVGTLGAVVSDGGVVPDSTGSSASYQTAAILAYPAMLG